jgi:hypothetical protein
LKTFNHTVFDVKEIEKIFFNRKSGKMDMFCNAKKEARIGKEHCAFIP